MQKMEGIIEGSELLGGNYVLSPIRQQIIGKDDEEDRTCFQLFVIIYFETFQIFLLNTPLFIPFIYMIHWDTIFQCRWTRGYSNSPRVPRLHIFIGYTDAEITVAGSIWLQIRISPV